MRSFYSLILFISFSFLTTHIASAEGFYKWKDAKGNIQYGDSPPANSRAKKIKMPKITVIDGFKEQWKPLEGYVTQVPIERKGEPVIYTQLAFIAPRNEQVMANSFNGAVSTILTIKPPLKKGHHIVLTLDGKSIPKSTSRTNNFSNLIRGVHTVLAKIVDKKGETVKLSEPISFRVMRIAPGSRKKDFN